MVMLVEVDGCGARGDKSGTSMVAGLELFGKKRAKGGDG